MFIPYFECSGHHQFSLPGILKIEVEFTSATQIIIGSNGAGKTTLMREMNPLPAQSSDYAPNGYKRIIIIDKGNRFFLESFFGKPVKHTFEMNGVNLNVSGKETEQRKLVKDHFGITPQLMKLATGEIQFSTLSAQARRDWLMSISGMNFEYGMQFFQRVRDFNRESTALSKSMTGREADEIEKLGQIGDVSVLKERSNELSQAITQLMRMQTVKDTRTSNEIKFGVQRKLDRIKSESEQLVRALPRELVYRFEDVGSIEDLRVHTQALQREGERYRAELTELYRKKEDLVKLAERTREEGISLEDEKNEIESLRQLIYGTMHDPDLPYELFLTDDVLFSSIDEFFSKFQITLEGYVDNTKLEFNSERYKELTALEAEIKLTSTDIDRQLNGVIHAIKHQEEAPDADCPDCGKHFKIGNAETKIAELEEEKIRLENLLLVQMDRKSIVDGHMREFQEFTAARRDIFLILDSNTTAPIRKLKEAIEQREKMGTGRRGLQDVLATWYEMITLSRQVVKAQKELSQREFTLGHVLEVEQLRKHYEGTQLDDVDVEIDHLIRAVDNAKNEIKAANELVEITTKQLAKFDELMRLRDTLKGDLEEFSLLHEQELINETLLVLQTELAGIQTTVSKVDSIQHTIDNLTKYRSEAEREAEASKMLMEMVSPNTGLIAEHVFGFLGDFTEEINRFIGQVWGYEMEVLPCKLDADVIDYRFPVRIANDDRIRPDIAQTSKGQLAFINLVFRLVILSSVDKVIFPLYLDEPTEGFDEQHCENFVRFIKSYLEQGATEQVIMISHDFAGHASFVHAETMVIDETNVLNKPPRYNQHVRYTYS